MRAADRRLAPRPPGEALAVLELLYRSGFTPVILATDRPTRIEWRSPRGDYSAVTVACPPSLQRALVETLIHRGRR